MFAIVDVNNFYASVEKVFNPLLAEAPVVILSNNDGCVIARSAEAKAMGIKMGQPAFLSKAFFEKNKVKVFSSNYTLYHDMSCRVMNILTSFVPEIEIYSIDEAFLSLQNLNKYLDLEAYVTHIRNVIYQWTGLPVSIGIAPTKTLAKVANRFIKKDRIEKGILCLNDPKKTEFYLEKLLVQDLWGIGKQHSQFLNNHNITNCLQFVNANSNWIKKNLTVRGARTQMELKGISCIAMEIEGLQKKGISTTRCFGKDVFDLDEIKEALVSYISRACEKLREENMEAGSYTVILHTNPFRKDIEAYSSSIKRKLPHQTSNSNEIISHAIAALKTIYKAGICYYKTGIILSHLQPATSHQWSLQGDNHIKSQKLMRVVDKMNKEYGKGTLIYGAEGFDKKWKLKINYISQKYTTDLNDVIKIYK